MTGPGEKIASFGVRAFFCDRKRSVSRVELCRDPEKRSGYSKCIARVRDLEKRSVFMHYCSFFLIKIWFCSIYILIIVFDFENPLLIL